MSSVVKFNMTNQKYILTKIPKFILKYLSKCVTLKVDYRPSKRVLKHVTKFTPHGRLIGLLNLLSKENASLSRYPGLLLCKSGMVGIFLSYSNSLERTNF